MPCTDDESGIGHDASVCNIMLTNLALKFIAFKQSLLQWASQLISHQHVSHLMS